jgi:ribosomal protein L21E
MTIDINQLTEAELIDLNHRIVERLRLLTQMKAHVAMMEFKIGDRVTFQPDPWETVEGMLTRYNKKTVTVIDDNGRQWNVSPGLLKKLESFILDPTVQKAIPLLKNRKSSKNKRK